MSFSISNHHPSSISSHGDTNHVAALVVYLALAAGENTLALGNPTNLAPNFDRIVVSRGTPTGLQAAAGNGEINLSWIAPASASGTTFNLYRGTNSGGESMVPIASKIATTNFTDLQVKNGVTYFYTVTSVNPVLGGESPPSLEVSATPYYATSSTAYQSALLAASPVAYWRMEELTGTTARDWAGGHNGTYGNAVTLGEAGPRPPDFLGFEVTNTAAQFANSVNNSLITIPALNLNTNTVTFTTWIYPLGSQAGYTGLVFYRSGGTVAGMNFNSAGTDLGYTWNDNSGTWGWSSGVQPPANQWSFLALVVQPAGATVYLFNTNGKQSAVNSMANPNQAFSGTGTLGTDSYSSTTRAFNGIMDEVAVFKQALTRSQLQQLYAAGFELPQVQVTLQPAGGSLNLSWPQGTLLEAANLAGPWQPVTDALSPFSVQPTNNAMFFRVLLKR